jgi:hypothetical protein
VRTGRIVLLIVGVVLVLTGMGVGAAGVGVLWAGSVGRDADGYLTSPTFTLESDAYALSSEDVELVSHPGDWAGWIDRVDVRLRVTPREGSGPVFVGIAPVSDAAAYLEGVGHDQVTRLTVPAVSYRTAEGGPPAAPPGDETFWAASDEGSGTRTLDWSASPGTWTLVVMNADGSPGVAVDARAGVLTGSLVPLGLLLLLAALLLIGGGTAAIVVALHEDRAPVVATSPPFGSPHAAASSVTLLGHLDEPLSRGLWLVKWLLLIPHYLVLAFLWLAFVVLTIVAGIAILVTGRYPRALFDVNVGIMRWTWRVSFYGYSALGTDRYPPFTLADDDHPARLDVVYPERLSRGLVLVKWLLAVPHLLIVGILTGGAASWSTQVSADQSWQFSLGGGLIGLLVLVAGVTLLVRGRYPTGLFDLVVGLDRWVVRVVAYVALMTDDYPPFRLDSGGDEPRPAPPGPGTGAGTDEVSRPPAEFGR